MNNVLKHILTVAALSMAAIVLDAKDYKVSSPDNDINVTVSVGEKLVWTVVKGDEVLLKDNEIALRLNPVGPARNMRVLGPAAKVKSTAVRHISEEQHALVPSKFRDFTDNCNELEIRFRDGWTLRFRAYDNGVAYRFETDGKGRVEVDEEVAEFNFNEDVHTFWPRESNPDFITHCEARFDWRKLSSIEPEGYAYLPVYCATAKGTNMVITESDLNDYPCMFLFGDHTASLSAKFPPFVLEARLKQGADRDEEMVRKADYIAVTSASRTYPWRIVTIDGSDAELLENNLPYQLASKEIEGDHSWIRPGKVAWDWWNALNIYGVDFESGINTDTYKYYVDFAAAYGLEYILLDEGWSISTLDISRPCAELDMEELTSYARSKGVGVILWALWNPMRDNLDGIMDIYRDWGISGIKIDFMQRCDQEMVNIYERIAKAAHDRHILVDFHGAFKPAGLQRKYPNVLSFEGVYGLEQSRWSDTVTPGHDCILPFTRMVAGPMDYTPGACLNGTRSTFVGLHDASMSQGTRAHQAAMYVIYESPLQMLCDSPSHYLREPEYTGFIAGMPTVWDETIGIGGEAGKYVAMARRSGDRWYVAAMTDWTPRDMEVVLDFIGEGAYNMTIFADGVNAGKNAVDFKLSTREVNRLDKIAFHLASGGGWAAILSPLK